MQSMSTKLMEMGGGECPTLTQSILPYIFHFSERKHSIFQHVDACNMSHNGRDGGNAETCNKTLE